MQLGLVGHDSVTCWKHSVSRLGAIKQPRRPNGAWNVRMLPVVMRALLPLWSSGRADEWCGGGGNGARAWRGGG